MSKLINTMMKLSAAVMVATVVSVGMVGCDPASPESVSLNIGEETKIKAEATANNTQYGLSLKVTKVTDERCPTSLDCFWQGNAAVDFHLTTATGEYDFTLDTYRNEIATDFKNDIVIEGIRYALTDVSPYPVNVGEKPPKKTVTVFVDKP